MSWTTVYIIIVSCIALQSIIRDIANLYWLLNKPKRKKRTVDIDLIKKRVAGVYEDDDDE